MKILLKIVLIIASIIFKPNIITIPNIPRLSVPRTQTLPIVKSKGIVHLLTRITLANASVFIKKNGKRNVKKYKLLKIFFSVFFIIKFNKYIYFCHTSVT